jgi:hypothetical protein
MADIQQFCLAYNLTAVTSAFFLWEKKKGGGTLRLCPAILMYFDNCFIFLQVKVPVLCTATQKTH